MYNIQYFEDKAAVKATYGETFETLPSNVIAMYGDNEGMIFTSSDSNPYQEGENEIVELVLSEGEEDEDDTVSSISYDVEASDTYVNVASFTPDVTFDMLSAGAVKIGENELTIGMSFSKLDETMDVYVAGDDLDSMCCIICLEPEGIDIEGGMLQYGINYAGVEGVIGTHVEVDLPEAYIVD